MRKSISKAVVVTLVATVMALCSTSPSSAFGGFHGGFGGFRPGFGGFHPGFGASARAFDPALWASILGFDRSSAADSSIRGSSGTASG
jgi:hypothetical protein